MSTERHEQAVIERIIAPGQALVRRKGQAKPDFIARERAPLRVGDVVTLTLDEAGTVLDWRFGR